MAMNNPKEQYLKIPYRILNIGGLGLSEKVLLSYINSFGRKGCWQSNTTLAKVLSTNTRQIQYWIKRIHNYIVVRCPRGYYRTMWVKSNPDVIKGIKDWQEKQDARRAKRKPRKPRATTTNPAQSCNAEVRQILHTQYDKSCTHSTTNPAVEPRQILHTINNHTIKEITKDTTAPPTPLPASGQASAVLDDRKLQQVKEIGKLKNSFGRKPPKKAAADNLASPEFQQKKQKAVEALLASA